MPDIFVPPDWIATTDQNIVVVDVRHEDVYTEGHLPGAVSIPFDEFRDPSDETEGKLPTAAGFASLLSEAGITTSDHLVAYGDDHGVYASRFLVTAEIFGHEFGSLHLLNGDFEVWARNNETTTEQPQPQPTSYDCQRRDDTPLVSAAELEEALDGDAVIVDTRDPLEYDTVHLPGAVNFQWRELVDDNTRQLKSHETIDTILDDYGMTPTRPIRLYCNTARRLSFVYTVLRDLGYEDVAFYEGGISTWTAYGGPVETTPAT